MEQQMRLALRNWRETGDARFAIQFTSLFERSNIPIQPLSDGQELFILKTSNDDQDEHYAIHRTEDEALADAGYVILEILEGDNLEDAEAVVRLVTDGDLRAAIDEFNVIHERVSLVIIPVIL